MRAIGGIDPGWGITAVRVLTAIILIVAGYQKVFIFGVFAGVTASMAKVGLPVPSLFALLASVIELVGGIAILIGLFTRWLGAVLIIEFLIAAFWVKFRLMTFNDGRVDMMLIGAGILFLLAGPGKAALDEMWLEKGK